MWIKQTYPKCSSISVKLKMYLGIQDTKDTSFLIEGSLAGINPHVFKDHIVWCLYNFSLGRVVLYIFPPWEKSFKLGYPRGNIPWSKPQISPLRQQDFLNFLIGFNYSSILNPIPNPRSPIPDPNSPIPISTPNPKPNPQCWYQIPVPNPNSQSQSSIQY